MTSKTHARPSTELRHVSRGGVLVLQQLWSFYDLSFSAGNPVWQEWRDVPVVEE